MTERLAYLFERFKQRSCTYEELRELLQELQDGTARQNIEQLTDADWQELKHVASEASQVDWDFMFASIIENAKLETGIKKRPSYIKLFTLGRLSAAAVLLSVIVISAVYLTVFRNKTGADFANTNKEHYVQEDLAPGGDKAILTLANGRQIVLDTAANGALTKQGGVRIIKIGGQLTYNPESTGEDIVYNTISTPRGGQYQLELADGTKVWLNAASSLRFPTAFNGNIRSVELAGEGYFEVSHNPAKPFHVKVNDLDVQVLGTDFNINAYTDEANIKTTLLQGSVRVSKGKYAALIKPGEQSRTNTTSDEIVVKGNIDLEGVVAWKNGKFQFDKADVKTIMRQIARWYDVEVIFEGQIPDKKFNGKMYRNVNASHVLKILEEGGIHFRIDGKKVIVMEGK